MAYTPTVWANGDTITAANLNKIEQGIANIGQTPIIKVNTNNVAATVFVRFAYGLYNAQEDYYELVKIVDPNETADVFAMQFIPTTGSNTYYFNNLPIPTNGLTLLFVAISYGNTFSYSGDIGSSDVVAVWGSSANARVITGNCEITINY